MFCNRVKLSPNSKKGSAGCTHAKKPGRSRVKWMKRTREFSESEPSDLNERLLFLDSRPQYPIKKKRPRILAALNEPILKFAAA